jgi:hypothetical protein
MISPNATKNSFVRLLFKLGIYYISKYSKDVEILNKRYKLSTIATMEPVTAQLFIFRYYNLGEKDKLYMMLARPSTYMSVLLEISTILIFFALINPSAISFAP